MPKILYVEDDEDTRTLLEEILTEEGYAVTSVPSAEAALAELESQRFDLLLTDYVLPGHDGAWLIREAVGRELFDPRAAIVLSSEHAPAGIDGHVLLRKPVDLDVLFSTLAKAVPPRHETSAPEALPSHPRAAVVLHLYVTGRSHQSMKALRKVRQVIGRFGAERVHLVVMDVERLGDDPEMARALEEDGIIVTPTLVRRMPLPKLWIAGDLSRKGALDEVLAALREVDRASLQEPGAA